MKSILLILLAFFISLAAHADSGDFFIGPLKRFEFQRSGKLVQSFAATDDCKARIRGLLCLVEPFKEGEPRECLEGSDAYTSQMEAVYDSLPKKMQPVFCSLKVIFVEKSLESLAYAGINGVDAEGPFNAVMGIREELLTKDFPASEVLSWKEQKAFGVVAPPFKSLPGSPLVAAKISGSKTALQYVLIHEIGHILDFSNSANQFVCKAGENCDDEDRNETFMRKHEPVAGSWSALSWSNWLDPKPSFDFPLQSSLCFYNCGGKGLNLAQTSEFYREINAVEFVTSYSSVNPWEDFAESTAFHFLSQQTDFEYHLKDPTTTYFLNRKWYAMKDKREWVEKFYAQDLKFPRIKN